MQYFILAAVLVFVIFVSFVVVTNVKRKNKMKNDVLNLLERIAEENKINNYKLYYYSKSIYDIYFETLTHVYYIKLIPNFQNAEISVNSPYKWEVRENLSERKPKFIDGIYEFLNMKTSDTKKQITKIAIIYPNARALMRYINECELNFVYPDTNISGCFIMTYESINSNHDLIDGR